MMLDGKVIHPCPGNYKELQRAEASSDWVLVSKTLITKERSERTSQAQNAPWFSVRFHSSIQQRVVFVVRRGVVAAPPHHKNYRLFICDPYRIAEATGFSG